MLADSLIIILAVLQLVVSTIALQKMTRQQEHSLEISYFPKSSLSCYYVAYIVVVAKPDDEVIIYAYTLAVIIII